MQHMGRMTMRYTTAWNKLDRIMFGFISCAIFQVIQGGDGSESQVVSDWPTLHRAIQTVDSIDDYIQLLGKRVRQKTYE